VYRNRRKIRLIESNAKCRSLKKFTCIRDFAAGVFICLRPLPSYDPTLPPLTHCIRVYSSHGGGGGGGGELTRKDV
jgi:hypothetical protein